MGRSSVAVCLLLELSSHLLLLTLTFGLHQCDLHLVALGLHLHVGAELCLRILHLG